MRKGWIIGIIAILLLIAGIVLGIYVYNINNIQKNNSVNERLANTKDNNQTIENAIHTVYAEERIAPNCKIVEKQYYKGCDHIIRDEKEIDENYINYTREEFAKAYKDWEIEEFDRNNIIVYKENSGYCEEHYVIREHNGVLAIYTVDENGVETLKEDTEILTMYMPEEDIQKFKIGVQVVGNANLHSILEDFE